ncbi:Uncharacterised protein [Myroides odoratus]|uniref:Uncharacterized protein n=2 Tax=Myroides odoratus TaxID=256 RepID=A0A9Q6ZAY1_MYROD|nr:hypothetical protein [Myroides odoratus]EHQ42854.1 hypothetical protein Myrod_2023 [Myroides odoratus DSM 2801]EKB07432.1 hypothetical protein HMPREF9716_01882 [Myroides odoratus CIP 103059]QQU00210.1 hypothetical protein I6I88_00060 [Myroides odoratus]STZ30119.1 Uncharacterised protein [Myroides odoratus]
MNPSHQKIIDLVSEYMERHPEQRFAQILFNLRINEFKEGTDFILRDIYNDSDEAIQKRMQDRLIWFDLQQKVNRNIKEFRDSLPGMTVNERLYLTNLMDDFDIYRLSNKKFAAYILRELGVDQEAIDQMLSSK